MSVFDVCDLDCFPHRKMSFGPLAGFNPAYAREKMETSARKMTAIDYQVPEPAYIVTDTDLHDVSTLRMHVRKKSSSATRLNEHYLSSFFIVHTVRCIGRSGISMNIDRLHMRVNPP